jgi:hypothetical protein
MSDRITNEQYANAMYILHQYTAQLNKEIELLLLRNQFVNETQVIDRKLLQLKDEQLERIQKEIDTHKARRS